MSYSFFWYCLFWFERFFFDVGYWISVFVYLLIDVLSYGFGIFGSILSFWLSVFSIGWKCVVFIIIINIDCYLLLLIVIYCYWLFFVLIVVFFCDSFFVIYCFMFIYRFSGHSDGVIPGLVSIPEVKSVTFCLVLWRYLWEFHFAASLFFILFCITLLYCFLCFFFVWIFCVF